MLSLGMQYVDFVIKWSEIRHMSTASLQLHRYLELVCLKAILKLFSFSFNCECLPRTICLAVSHISKYIWIRAYEYLKIRRQKWKCFKTTNYSQPWSHWSGWCYRKVPKVNSMPTKCLLSITSIRCCFVFLSVCSATTYLLWLVRATFVLF